MASSVRRRARDIERELLRHVVPERRERAKSYFASSLRVLGVPVPAIRAVVREQVRELRPCAAEDVIALARALVRGGMHEGRQVGWEIMARRTDAMDLLEARDVEALGQGNDNWASVDAFAVSVAGPAWRAGRITDADVRRWASSADPWWRRTALVSTVALNKKSRGGVGDPARTLDVCGWLRGDHHPAVVKALSWALRDVVCHDAESVRRFLDRHGAELHARVTREVTNKLETGRKNA